MCVLASVRIFSVVCFERVRTNSTCGALSVRSGRPLEHFEVTTGSFWRAIWPSLRGRDRALRVDVRRGGCERRAMVSSILGIAATLPPLALLLRKVRASLPCARAIRVNPLWDSHNPRARPPRPGHNFALAPLSGHKNIIRLFCG
jgi:hypothetical protein